jgi:hypothetical protein
MVGKRNNGGSGEVMEDERQKQRNRNKKSVRCRTERKQLTKGGTN